MGYHTGIDIGLGVTSITTIDDDGKIVSSKRFGTKVNKYLVSIKEETPLSRYGSYAAELYDYCANYPLGTVIMENPQTRQIGNGLRIYTLRGSFLVVLDGFIHDTKMKHPVPGMIKKFWTGNGQATKETMILEAENRGYGILDEHDADSLAMAHMSINYKWE